MKRTALLREVPQCAAPDEISKDVLTVSQIVEHELTCFMMAPSGEDILPMSRRNVITPM